MAADGIVINRIERPEGSEGQRNRMFFLNDDVTIWVFPKIMIPPKIHKKINHYKPSILGHP